MKKYLLAALCVAAVPAPAFAQDVGPVSISGTAALVTDYRYRGVSQSDEAMAVQAGVTLTHDASGIYVGTWGSSLAGWGTFGGANMELDLFAGVAIPLGAATLDVGATWYMYPSGADTTDFIEPYVKLSGDIGPATALVGVAYAPKQEALGNWSATPQSVEGASGDNLYLWGDLAVAVPQTPLTLKAHLGYSDGNPGLGPNGTSIAPTGDYFDWSLGVDLALGPVTLGVAYVDTSIGNADRQYLLPNFGHGEDGSNIAATKLVGSISLAF